MTAPCAGAGPPGADIEIATPGELAAALLAGISELAGWIEDELAGGTPAKWVAQTAALAAWHIAGAARVGA